MSSASPSSPSNYTPSDIQSHLYLSFLHGYTSDVSLHVKAKSWEAVYHLHRVVLIQAGFFRSLFTAGFLESQELRGSTHSVTDDVYVHFDDINITKAAFEICIARLYGGGPKLYVPPVLLATATHPLTPAFHDNTISFACPADHHPATPHFLLSLLATSIYLSIPSVTSQALSLILSSIGPYTIVRYLNFAIGKGIGSVDGADLESAVGLEHVGKPVVSRPETRSSTPTSLPSDSFSISSQNESHSGTVHKIGNIQLLPNGNGDTVTSGHPSSKRFVEIHPFNYGGIGDKVGESCACWLLRWGVDMLSFEGLGRSSPYSPTLSPSEQAQAQAQTNFPSIWTKSGMTSPWACAVIASDDFFVKGEWERYEFATKIIQLRCRQQSDFAEEEADWTNLFANGIRYCHLTFEELVRILQDICPFTGQPYVPTEVIHSAHWMQSILRHRILARPSGLGRTASPTPPPQSRELGVTLTSSEIAENHFSVITGFKPPVVLYPVPNDSSQRIGDVDNAFSSGAASIDQLLGNISSQSHASHPLPSQSNFFGILSPCQTTSSVSDPGGKTRWSPFPPFRFGVEFWGIEDLPEKSRIHSHTIWYAGSLFNVYIQIVKKKGIQLGIYLQRQSTIDPLPRPSTPAVLKRERAITVTGYNNNYVEQPVSRTINPMPSLNSIVSERAVPGSPRLSPQPESPTHNHFHISSSPSRSGVSTPTAPVPIQPYRDPRITISAHFTISCTTKTGSSLTRFTSSPDQFSVSQSWGWKSSSLRSDDGDLDPLKKPRSSIESSLRATVVLGLV